MLAARCLMLNSYLIFLRTFDDQYRRRQVVDQCSLWKERPLVEKYCYAIKCVQSFISVYDNK